jgi:transcriptional regulator with XRE-family HTH domain
MNVTGTSAPPFTSTAITPSEPQAESVIAKAARKAWLTGAILTGTLGTVAFSPQIPTREPVVVYWSGAEQLSEELQPAPADTNTETADRVDAGAAIRQLRDRSGLTWDQLARLFGVSRRAVHLWAAGGRMNSRNLEFLGLVERLVNNVPASTPEERRALLFSQDSGGRSLYDAMRNFHAPKDDGSESGYAFDQLIGALHDRK